MTPKPAVASRPPTPAVTPPKSTITGAIQRAAQATGASFEYLLATAKVESNLNPNIRANTSSATGLFQFIEQTWLGMMKTTGRALGFGSYADAISLNSAGRYEVTDAQMREEILQLRRDPAASATMAAAFTRQNAAELQERLGRAPTDGELYIAHFFGTGGAAKLIETAQASPHANAAELFPNAARANRSVFYDRQGQARSVSGVYAELNRRYQAARTQTAGGAAEVAAVPAAATASAPVPDTAGTTQALAMAAEETPLAQPKPDFRSLFHTELRGAVAPVVSELWTVPRREGPFDLFRDTPANARDLFRGGS